MPDVTSTAELRRRIAALGAGGPPLHFQAPRTLQDPARDVGADVQHYAAGTLNVRMLFRKVMSACLAWMPRLGVP